MGDAENQGGRRGPRAPSPWDGWLRMVPALEWAPGAAETPGRGGRVLLGWAVSLLLCALVSLAGWRFVGGDPARLVARAVSLPCVRRSERRVHRCRLWGAVAVATLCLAAFPLCLVGVGVHALLALRNLTVGFSFLLAWPAVVAAGCAWSVWKRRRWRLEPRSLPYRLIGVFLVLQTTYELVVPFAIPRWSFLTAAWPFLGLNATLVIRAAYELLAPQVDAATRSFQRQASAVIAEHREGARRSSVAAMYSNSRVRWLYVLSLLPLVVFSVSNALLADNTEDSGALLALSVSITVVLLDMATLLLHLAGVLSRLRFISLVVGLSRVGLVAFGARWWFIGTSVVYTVICSLLVAKWAKRLASNRWGEQPFSLTPSRMTMWERLTTPQAVFILLTVCFCGAIAFVRNVQPSGLPLTAVPIIDGAHEQWVFGLGALVLVCDVSMVCLAYRFLPVSSRWRVALYCAVEVAFSASGLALFAITNSVIVLFAFIFGPIVAGSVAKLFKMWRADDFVFFVPSDWGITTASDDVTPRRNRSRHESELKLAAITMELRGQKQPSALFARGPFKLVLLAATVGSVVGFGVLSSLFDEAPLLGWTIALFAMEVILTSAISTLWYNTLEVSAPLVVLCSMATSIHVIIHYVVDAEVRFSQVAKLRMVMSMLLYPSVGAGILAVVAWQDNDWALSKRIAAVLAGSAGLCAGLCVFGVISGAVAGTFLVGALVVGAYVSLAVMFYARWMHEAGRSPPNRWLNFAIIAHVGLLLGSIGAGIHQYVEYPESSAFTLWISVPFIAAMMVLAIVALVLHIQTRDFTYVSAVVLPVMWFDRDNNAMSEFNILPILLMTGAALATVWGTLASSLLAPTWPGMVAAVLGRVVLFSYAHDYIRSGHIRFQRAQSTLREADGPRNYSTVIGTASKAALHLLRSARESRSRLDEARKPVAVVAIEKVWTKSRVSWLDDTSLSRTLRMYQNKLESSLWALGSVEEPIDALVSEYELATAELNDCTTEESLHRAVLQHLLIAAAQSEHSRRGARWRSFLEWCASPGRRDDVAASGLPELVVSPFLLPANDMEMQRQWHVHRGAKRAAALSAALSEWLTKFSAYELARSRDSMKRLAADARSSTRRLASSRSLSGRNMAGRFDSRYVSARASSRRMLGSSRGYDAVSGAVTAADPTVLTRTRQADHSLHAYQLAVLAAGVSSNHLGTGSDDEAEPEYEDGEVIEMADLAGGYWSGLDPSASPSASPPLLSTTPSTVSAAGELANAESDVEMIKEICRKCHMSQSLHVDNDFEGDIAIGEASLIARLSGSGEVEWRRASRLRRMSTALRSTADPGRDTQQGILGDCWLLSALSVLAAQRPRAVHELFVETKRMDTGSQRFSQPDEVESAQFGVFGVRIYSYDRWVTVVVDDQVPIDPERRRTRSGKEISAAADTAGTAIPVPAFASSRSGETMWMAIVEKAFAKHYGSYAALNGGMSHHALRDLTGGYAELFRFANPDVAFSVDDGSLWGSLRRFASVGHLLGAGNPSASTAADAQLARTGIEPGHSYAVLQLAEETDTRGTHQLVQLRNPWGESKWKGRWAASDRESWTRRMQARLNYSPRDLLSGKQPDDGTFWMDFNDFVRLFEFAFVCRTFESVDQGGMWHRYDVRGAWTADNAGGCPNFPSTCHKSPHYHMLPSRAGEIFIQLNVSYPEDESEAHGMCPIGFKLLDKDGMRVKTVRSHEVVMKSEYLDDEQVTAEAFVPVPPHGHPLTLFASTFEPGQVGKFKITVFTQYPLQSLEDGKCIVPIPADTAAT